MKSKTFLFPEPAMAYAILSLAGKDFLAARDLLAATTGRVGNPALLASEAPETWITADRREITKTLGLDRPINLDTVL